MSTKVENLPDGGTAAVNDYFVGESTPGTTVKLTYAPTLSMDPTPGLANDLTLNGFDVGAATATEIGYLSGVTSAIQTQLNDKVTTSGLGAGVNTFLTTPSSANLAAALTDETGTGAAVFATSPALLTPTATGITNAGSAAAGIVGEVLISSWVTTAGLTANVAVNVTSLALTAGDWDLWGVGTTIPAGTTTTTFAFFAINTTTASVPPATSIASSSLFAGGQAVAGQPMAGQVPAMRVNISGTTTYYLNTVVNFAVSTMTAAGYIIARRRR